jgi:hypothetical protein
MINGNKGRIRGVHGLGLLRPHFLKVKERGFYFLGKRMKIRKLLRSGRIVIWIIIGLVGVAFLFKKFIQL